MFRSDFPIFASHPDLVYLDSASTAQKPRHVINAMSKMLEESYANIHRGAYDLSEMAEAYYESSKEHVARHLGWVSRHEIVYTYNATYAFNLLTRSLVKSGILNKGDHVLLSLAEHHANIVPWQILAEEYGIIIDWIDLHPDGTIDYDSLERQLPQAKVLSITGASNVTGEVLDLEKVKWFFANCQRQTANDKPPLFIIDGSQRFPHMETDVRKYGIDFFVATGHKVMSDTGIGFFYGRKDLLKMMEPAFCGGGAINSVTRDGYEAAGLPHRFEPGTPHIVGARSLLASLEYIESIGGFRVIEKYERELTEYALEQFAQLPSNIRLLGSKKSENRLGVFSFVFEDNHPRDIADALAEAGIAVRAGHHCTDPLHQFLGIPASLRMSLYIYNTREDVENFIRGLNRAKF